MCDEMCILCDIFKDSANMPTTVYDKNDDIIVFDCEIHHRPVIVWRKHSTVLSPGDILHIIKVLTCLFGDGILIDTTQYREFNHLHWHVVLDY